MANSIQEYRGKEIVIRFDGNKCIHSRNCVLGQPDVFVAGGKPWIKPDGSSAENIAALVQTCPSGALTYERLDGGQPEQAPGVNALRVRENGPLAFHAEMVVGGQPAGYRATLCRCGASKTKPLCDSSHTAIGFSASGEPATQESQPLAVRNGPLKVSPQPNGPLKVEGALEICSGTGRTITRTTETWLCRCGGSKNKPFCDGTHKKIGFAAA
jgi:CDGSH-type Zn-finger protein/uncharacterized Fe-S cluster protein YjdI